MTADSPDHDAAIAAALKARQQAQAAYDAVKHTFDTCSIIDRKVALVDAERRLVELRGAKAAAQAIEPRQSRAIFFGSNS